jgi:hypothetical protein
MESRSTVVVLAVAPLLALSVTVLRDCRTPGAPSKTAVLAAMETDADAGERWRVFEAPNCGFRIEYARTGSVLRNSGCHLAIQSPFGLSLKEAGTRLDFLYEVIVHPNPKRVPAAAWPPLQFTKIFEEAPEDIRRQGPAKIGRYNGYAITVAEGDQDGVHQYVAGGDRMYELAFSDPESVPDITPIARDRWREGVRHMTESFRIR